VFEMTDCKKKLVILAGGKGTRLQSVLVNKPKPLATLDGRSLLMRQIDSAVDQGVDEVHLMIHHLADQIRDHIGDGEQWGVPVRYHTEFEPRGTAGCVLQALADLPDRFLVFYGDTLVGVDIDRIWKYHCDHEADATLLVHPNSHPYDSDLIELAPDDRVTAFHHVPHDKGKYYANLVNAALYVVEKDALKSWQESEEKLDFARHLFPRMLQQGANLYGYRTREYIKDMGTPDRLVQGELDLKSGKVDRLSISKKATAIFLDRDGTMNVEKNRIKDPADFELIEGVANACKQINQSGALAVVVTNQPVIARGDCTVEDLKVIHNKLEWQLGEQHAYVDSIYYCPHHPDSGFEGEIAELKIECDCRKPKIGMLTQAAHDLNIDLGSSWMVGDTTRDIATGLAAGTRTVLVRTGYAGRDYFCPVRADYEFYDLADATPFMLHDHARLISAASEMVQLGQGRVIVIGGRSRSGKSTWASICRESLRNLGRNAHIISMDGWLKPESQRGANVRERFNVPAFVETVQTILHSKDETQLHHPVYDRIERRVLADKGPRLTIRPDDVLILEGVITLGIPKLMDVASRSFFVRCDESIFQKRFLREYLNRGYTESETLKLLNERQIDELADVDRSMHFADHVVDLTDFVDRIFTDNQE
jgi:D,D-heptose 1,7-bisphosphate phosphatase